jgi:hypothetical protein
MKISTITETKHCVLVQKDIEVSTFKPSSLDYFKKNPNFRVTRGVKKYVIRPIENEVLSDFVTISVSFDKYHLKGLTFTEQIKKELCGPVFKEFVSSEEEILSVMACLARNQPRGESGILANDGSDTLIGFVACADGVWRPVYMRRSFFNRKWICSCGRYGIRFTGAVLVLRKKIIN